MAKEVGPQRTRDEHALITTLDGVEQRVDELLAL